MPASFPAGLPRLRVVPGTKGDDGVSPVTDAELVLALRNGESAKAALLYDRLIHVVDRTLVRILGRREQDHDDLVQSVFEQIIVALTRGRFAGACSLSGWAAAVACNHALNVLRSRVRERKVVDRSYDAEIEGAGASVPIDVERQLGARSELLRVRGELSQMNQDRATALLLYDVFGHELAEIAVLTNVSVSAAQSRLVRGRKELNERMQKADGGNVR